MKNDVECVKMMCASVCIHLNTLGSHACFIVVVVLWVLELEVLLVMLLFLLDGEGDGGDDNIKTMITIDMLYTVTAGAGTLLYFTLSSHSPLSFVHDGPVNRKRGSTYTLL